ncbi:MAG TPA: hypothetical protein VNC41_10430 [Acidimicrobiia bacterium]|nr:hypothetical protein [Acidimicrobiia bacterium]
MGVVLLVIVAAGAVAIFGYIQSEKARQARAEALERVGPKPTLAPDGDAYDDVRTLPFALFDEGERRRAGDVLAGSANDLAIRIFDYEYETTRTTTSTDANGHTQTSTTTDTTEFTCAVADLPGRWPHVRIGRESFFGTIGNALGFRDIEVPNSPEFNSAFKVRCADDSEFALRLLQPDLAQFILDAQGLKEIECNERWLLVGWERLDEEHHDALAGWVAKFRSLVPPGLLTS